MNNLAGFKGPTPATSNEAESRRSSAATSNWIDMDYHSTNLVKYFSEAHRDTFLVLIDRGYGAGPELDVMLGKHIVFRMRHVPSLQRPVILKFAHIWNIGG